MKSEDVGFYLTLVCICALFFGLWRESFAAGFWMGAVAVLATCFVSELVCAIQFLKR